MEILRYTGNKVIVNMNRDKQTVYPYFYFKR